MLKKSAQKIMNNSNKQGVGDETSVMFGATTDDLNKVLGSDPNIKNLDTEIKKHAAANGGVLNMRDMMKIQGVTV
jgi:hypothetical protein